MPFSLSVPDMSRERRDSTNSHIAKCGNGLLNIDEYGINNHNIISTPQSRTARQLPYIAPQHRGAKGYLFCPCERSEIGEVPQGEGVETIEPLLRVSERNAILV